MSTVIPIPANWADLCSSWEEIRHGYHAGDKDATVRDCARRLDTTAAGPKDGPVLFWTLGLLTLAPYVAFGDPGPGVEDEVTAALRRIARGDDSGSCAHGWHPYDVDVDEMLEHLPTALEVLNSPADHTLNGLLPADCLDGLDDGAEPANLSGPEVLDRWQCPRTAPGFARAALDHLGATVH
ncbi:hypothetical protein [Streptomyces yangpuensis]|uniref:hypothetical protein n=1 Tax=Streptomyces yangpuensis TaxID=1648182 RepID=UPI00364ECB6F